MRESPGRMRLIAFIALALSSAFCVVLLAIRPRVVGELGHTFLVWNLFLAWIPFVCALVVYDARRHERIGAGRWALLAAWLVFLPNAPYIVTDLIHLPLLASRPLWFDTLIYLAFAWTGLMLGLVSLLLVHRTIARVHGSAWGWTVVAASSALCGVGIYLGRFLRWNSWDVLANPSALAGDLSSFAADPLGAPSVIAGIFASFVGLGYLAVYAVSRVRE